jgi:ABC-type multidrug transport system ATPase subunit
MIIVDKIEKYFGSQRVLKNLSFKISKGEHVSLLGSNGAGKTTLVKILATLLKPSNGSASIAGFDILEKADKIRSCIGVVSHQSYLYRDLSAVENLRFYGQMFDVAKLDHRIDDVLIHVNLFHRRFDMVRIYSRGMVQRLLLARALLHHPPVLLLDEPLTGLDVSSRDMFNQFIENLKTHNVTLLSAGHDIEHAIHQSDRVLILKDGSLVLDKLSFNITSQELKENLR